MARLQDRCSKMTRANLLVLTGAFLALALPGSVALSQTKAAVPKFEVDPWWPKPLPEGWITGRLGSVCIDSHDHVIVTNRRDITDEEKERDGTQFSRLSIQPEING